MPAYATPAELAAALRVTLVTGPDGNEDQLQSCLDAAAIEIEDAVDRLSAPAAGDVALLKRVNILRGVEWWKANDAAFGILGQTDTGALHSPRDGFARHARVLLPLKEQFGVA